MPAGAATGSSPLEMPAELVRSAGAGPEGGRLAAPSATNAAMSTTTTPAPAHAHTRDDLRALAGSGNPFEDAEPRRRNAFTTAMVAPMTALEASPLAVDAAAPEAE
jgi:hypothetical protein